MSINWYPGHMFKATKDIKEILPNMDLIIEVLDARLPYSSENPVLAALKTEKPRIKLLNKADMADPAITELWLNQFQQQQNNKAMAISCTEQADKVRSIEDLCKKLVPKKEGRSTSINALIVGIPNVGKSTIINTLAGKMVAKSGNEPAVTKGQQKINLRNGIMLFDTPGVLWPKVENENTAYRLATTGAIKNTAMSYDDVAFFAADFLIKTYPDLLKQRYQLEHVPDTELEFLEVIGRKRGCLAGGGLVDLTKISEIFLSEIRDVKIGRISFETPEVAEREKAEVQAILEKKAEEKADKKAKRKQAFKSRKS